MTSNQNSDHLGLPRLNGRTHLQQGDPRLVPRQGARLDICRSHIGNSRRGRDFQACLCRRTWQGAGNPQPREQNTSRHFLQEIAIDTTAKHIKDGKEGLPPLRNPPLLETADDLATLSHLNEPSGR